MRGASAIGGRSHFADRRPVAHEHVPNVLVLLCQHTGWLRALSKRLTNMFCSLSEMSPAKFPAPPQPVAANPLTHATTTTMTTSVKHTFFTMSVTFPFFLFEIAVKEPTISE
jgi:hypothetical protein